MAGQEILSPIVRSTQGAAARRAHGANLPIKNYLPAPLMRAITSCMSQELGAA